MARGKAQVTLALELAILDIARERQPITVRGIAYALFVRRLIPSMAVGQTKRISKITVGMRESGTLPWEWIVDGSRPVEHAQTWSDPNEIVRRAVASYRRDNWQDQPTIVEVWSEKSTVQGVLAPVLEDLGITFRVMRGFNSATKVNDAAADSQAVRAHGKKAVVLYIGDWDPSGMCISEVDAPGRTKRYGGNWRIKRIAITRQDHGLPFFDADTKKGDDKKKGDSRYNWFVEHYGHRCWELDAMNPNILRERVRKEIERYIDRPLWEHGLMVETAQVEALNEYHQGWGEALLAGRRANLD